MGTGSCLRTLPLFTFWGGHSGKGERLTNQAVNQPSKALGREVAAICVEVQKTAGSAPLGQPHGRMINAKGLWITSRNKAQGTSANALGKILPETGKLVWASGRSGEGGREKREKKAQCKSSPRGGVSEGAIDSGREKCRYE